LAVEPLELADETAGLTMTGLGFDKTGGIALFPECAMIRDM
jgi:hypothetical protein